MDRGVGTDFPGAKIPFAGRPGCASVAGLVDTGNSTAAGKDSPLTPLLNLETAEQVQTSAHVS